MTYTETLTIPPEHRIGLFDYCARCTYDGCDRMDMLEQPEQFTLTARGITAAYVCSCCGRSWTCTWHRDAIEE